MIPLKDNLPTERAPALTLALVAACVAGAIAAGTWVLLVAALAVWLFARRVEDGHGPLKAAVLLALAAAAGAAAGGGSAEAVAGAATGAAVGAYAPSWAPAKILGLVLVPFFVTVVEVPALLVGAILAGLAVLLGAPPESVLAATAAGAAMAALVRAEPRKWEPVT